jgi:hypothetical protein
VSQPDEHSAEQPSPLQFDMHPASQSDEQRSWHENVVGVVMHAVLHFVSHVSVQSLDAESVHFAEHVAVKFAAVHWLVQETDV